MCAALQTTIGRVNAIQRGIRWFVQIIKNYVLDYLRAINWFQLFEKAKSSIRILVDPTGGAGLSTSISHDQPSVPIANANASSNASSSLSTPGTDGRQRSKSTVAPINERERERLMEDHERGLERELAVERAVERAQDECDLMDVDLATAPATRHDAPDAPQPQAPANPLDLQNGYRDVLFGGALVVTIASLFGLGSIVSHH